MKAKPISKKLMVAKNMPPLKHSTGESFDIKKSEVVNWLIERPSILSWLFGQIADLRKNGERALIKYDDFTGTWQGVDYED